MSGPVDRKILIVDDDEVFGRLLENQIGLAKMPKGAHADIRIMDDPIHASELLHEEAFDLIVLDVRMPGLSGIELLEMIRKDEESQNKRAPVIILSGVLDEDSTKINMDVLDGTFLLEKPVDFNKLTALVERELLRRQPVGLSA